MATIVLDKLSKTYPNGFEAVKGVEMTVAEGELMVLVGPSGCGKTTLLRMIAGLEGISAGVLRIGDEMVNDVGPRDRDIAMVFQNYALYPHMTVAENIGFALKLAKVPKEEIATRVRSTADILALTEWLDRKPGQLSGGQRQRVAMGRAIVREPRAFLMDEPLSNLDAKLRVQMRAEISRIQRRLGVATVYVTHDQVEAMTMGDRVTVMREGIALQCADPRTLYEQPVDMFVGAFIGSPSMNLYEAALEEGAAAIRLGSQRIALPDAVRQGRPALARYAGRRVIVGLRPEHLPAAGADARGPVLEGDVDLVEALGSEMLVHFRIDATRVLAEGAGGEDQEQLTELPGHGGEGVARVEPRSPLRPGDRARFSVDLAGMHFFDPATGVSIAGEGDSAPPVATTETVRMAG